MSTTTPAEKRKRERSPEYPAESLKRCVELAQKLYERDRQSWTTSETAVKHLGYNTLNGKSRTTLSAIRKFGLIEYRGGDLRVTELAMRILVPKNPAEKTAALQEALLQPKLYQWFLEEFPGWDLPSDETMRARLIRDREFNPSAVKGILEDLKTSVEYVRDAGGLAVGEPAELDGTPSEAVPEAAGPASVRDKESAGAVRFVPPSGGHKLSVPGATWFVWLPDDMSPEDAKRMRDWITMVLTPQINFIAGDQRGQSPRATNKGEKASESS